jgi:hypothetical protein
MFGGEVQMHKYRIGFVTGLALGFVLGTRAGRERYEQLKKAARAVADNPAVQQAAGAVQAQASGLAATAGTKIADGVRERVPQLAKTARAKVEGRLPGRGSPGQGSSSGAGAHNGSSDGSPHNGGDSKDFDRRRFAPLGHRDSRTGH